MLAAVCTVCRYKARGLRPIATCWQVRKALFTSETESVVTPEVVVEYCVRCNYKPRFDILARKIREAFPDQYKVRANPTGMARMGAFEVSLQERGTSHVLWSKLKTGEPSNLEAVGAVAQLVVRELHKRSHRGQGHAG